MGYHNIYKLLSVDIIEFFFCVLVGGADCFTLFLGSAAFWAISASFFVFWRVGREGGWHNRRKASCRAVLTRAH